MTETAPKFEGKTITFQAPAVSPKREERMQVKEHTPVTANPPRIALAPIMHGWAALVMAVSSYCRVSHFDILQHEGRSSKRLADARRLLAWAFLEVADMDEELAIAWLEQCLQLGRRSILDGLRIGDPPAGLPEVVATYTRLMREMGPADFKEAIGAGIIGERRPRANIWPKGFGKKFGLNL